MEMWSSGHLPPGSVYNTAPAAKKRAAISQPVRGVGDGQRRPLIATARAVPNVTSELNPSSPRTGTQDQTLVVPTISPHVVQPDRPTIPLVDSSAQTQRKLVSSVENRTQIQVKPVARPTTPLVDSSARSPKL